MAQRSVTLTRAPILACAAIFVALTAHAEEPLVGRWLLVSQELGGQKVSVEDLTLRINPAGQALEFAYSVPVNNIQFVSLRFSVKLDGTQADVTNANGQKMGTVRLSKAGASQYRILLQGPNRPTATGTITISADGKTLKSESESTQRGQSAATHMVQVFSRQ
jgi:hypothetical protein